MPRLGEKFTFELTWEEQIGLTSVCDIDRDDLADRPKERGRSQRTMESTQTESDALIRSMLQATGGDNDQRAAWLLEHEDAITVMASELTTLRAELEQWRTWGIIEIAVRNPNVASYMEHWEGRALKAEAEIAHLQQEQARREEEAGFRFCVHGRTPLGSWCRECNPLRRS